MSEQDLGDGDANNGFNPNSAVDPSDYLRVEPGYDATPMDKETGKKILNMLLESKEENRRMHVSIDRLQHEAIKKEYVPRRPEHLPKPSAVQWKNVGCEEQFAVWDNQWTKLATADVKLDHVAAMLEEESPDLNRVANLIVEASTDVREGKEAGEKRMHELLLVNNMGWDFLREFKKPKNRN